MADRTCVIKNRVSRGALNESEIKEINSWSDGTWKFGKSGFYPSRSENNSYSEVILDNGKFYAKAKINRRDKEKIVFNTSKGEAHIQVNEIATITGISAEDSEKMKRWIQEIVDERLASAKPEISKEVISFHEADTQRITQVRARVLQVLDGGMLVSEFIGNLHKGTEIQRVTRTVTVSHPVTNQTISKVIGVTMEDYAVKEEVTDTLCFIAGTNSTIVDGQIIKADSMVLDGRYQYTAVNGAARTIPKFRVE